ncbi:DUF411 domain-containing protein [uncultured Comamonas sp.]|uniref:DUF411 domain-containing protein n=1 Tax=uncultured Comamonas sp. TaxID=114710 RepID=UPI0025DF9621|nr:DUF411 domain-containing protein [uncultured Comamonas sp.]
MTSTNRRHALHLLAAAAGVAALPAMATAPAMTAMEVWKDPNCGCCKDWIALMEQAGFSVKVHDVGNTTVRARLGLPARLGSCHTALVGGYLVEGHVPAADVHKLLRQKPKALGIAVPGMPIGSPGMDGPEYGGRKDPYDVLLVKRNLMNSEVSTSVFTSHRG